jgi:hypothetical protein
MGVREREKETYVGEVSISVLGAGVVAAVLRLGDRDGCRSVCERGVRLIMRRWWPT